MTSVTQTSEQKQCVRGEKCAHPDGPLLPLTEFYKHTNGKYYNSYCKACAKENSKNQKRRPKKQAGEPTERIVVDKLRGMGIYAVSGKASEFTHVDVVAWGCVRIEVKSTEKKEDGTYHFGFSSQYKRGIKGDLILLVALDGDQSAFYLFPSGHPAFYKQGRVKNAVLYMPFAHHRKRGEYLSTAVMNEHKDTWHLIEEKRQEIQRMLLTGQYEPKIVTCAAPLQPRLFEVA